MTDNLRGILLMIVAMAGFAVEDTLIKRMSDDLPIGQILAVLGFAGAVVFTLMARRRGAYFWSRDALHGAVLLRNGGELVGTLGYVTALALVPLSTASAILQATPLIVTLGAAVFLGAAVGWRRWSAVATGFVGVLLIIRPGMDGFEPAALFALQGAVGLAIRDVATRRVPDHISTMQLSAWAFATLVPAGLALLWLGAPPQIPDALTSTELAGALIMGVVGYYALTAAMRVGEIAVVTPFRYTRLVFALAIGAVVFGERPDGLTLIGAAIVIASGLYTLHREFRTLPSRQALS